MLQFLMITINISDIIKYVTCFEIIFFSNSSAVRNSYYFYTIGEFNRRRSLFKKRDKILVKSS